MKWDTLLIAPSIYNNKFYKMCCSIYSLLAVAFTTVQYMQSKLVVYPLSGEPLVVLTYYKYGTYGTTFKALETNNWI